MKKIYCFLLTTVVLCFISTNAHGGFLLGAYAKMVAFSDAEKMAEDGLKAISMGKYQQAYECFEKSISKCEHPYAYLGVAYLVHYGLGYKEDHSLSKLYMQKANEAYNSLSVDYKVKVNLNMFINRCWLSSEKKVYISKEDYISQMNSYPSQNTSIPYSVGPTGCIHCGGTGTCPECGGSGTKYNPTTGHTLECTYCHGSTKCYLCKGKGTNH